MNVLETLDRLFTQHAPETLMALFGALTSIWLFYLLWIILRHFFTLLTNDAQQEADQEQKTTVLVESLVSALVSEAGHLRHSLDGILEESLRCGEQNARALTILLTRTEKIPTEILQLLKPEFDHLHQEMAEAEARILTRVAEVAEVPCSDGSEQSIAPTAHESPVEQIVETKK